MAYAIGAKVEASTYDVFASQVNALMLTGSGTYGYGQDGSAVASSTDKTLITQASGSTIKGVEWLNLRNRIDDFNVHQGLNPAVVASGTIPASTAFDPGQPIIAFSGESARWNASSNLIANACNRLSAAASQLSTASVLLDGRTVAQTWQVQCIHQFTAKFSNGDAARHFFNSGGTITITPTFNAFGGFAKNADWTSIITRASTYTFGASVYYDLAQATAGSTYTTLKTTTGSAAAYTANDYTIKLTRDHISGTRGSMGSTLTFRCEFNDDAGDAGGADDLVIGTLQNHVNRTVSTGRIVGSAPTFTTVISVSAGS